MADLNFLNLTDCDAITFNTPTTDLQYIEYVTGSVVKDFTNVDKYTITTSTNCCSPGVTTNVAPRYQFVVTIDSCIDPTYRIKIDNINGNLIQSIQGSIDGGAFVPGIFEIIADELFIVIGAFNPITTVIARITTLSGFVYDVGFILTETAPCVATITDVTITYPPLPTNVVYNNTGTFATSGVLAPAIGIEFEIVADNIGIIGNLITIILPGFGVTVETQVAAWNAANPVNTATLTYTLGAGYTGNVPPTIILSGGIDAPVIDELSVNSLYGQTPILPGTYQITFCEVLQDATSTCIQNHIFIDCGTLKCQVVNKLVLCIDSNIMDFYNALVWGNDCTDTITYAEFCAIYEILIVILQTDGCLGNLDDCNCTDATTVANKLSPITYPTQPNNNPCTTC